MKYDGHSKGKETLLFAKKFCTILMRTITHGITPRKKSGQTEMQIYLQIYKDDSHVHIHFKTLQSFNIKFIFFFCIVFCNKCTVLFYSSMELSRLCLVYSTQCSVVEANMHVADLISGRNVCTTRRQ